SVPSRSNRNAGGEDAKEAMHYLPAQKRMIGAAGVATAALKSAA
ncbi:MAG: hypothetical protein JWO80_5418, partial [Bryobacterales bacterium]|nr:hypothetical protein [Bryobacterales bacterium]